MLNFEVYSYPDMGAYFIFVGAGLIALAWFLAPKKVS